MRYTSNFERRVRAGFVPYPEQVIGQSLPGEIETARTRIDGSSTPHEKSMRRGAAVLGLLLLALLLVGEASAVTFTVNSTSDVGDLIPGDGVCHTGGFVEPPGGFELECTIRASIEEANAGAGMDVVEFSPHLPVDGGGTIVFSPTTPYPAIVDPIEIRGSTAPGYDTRAPVPIPVISLSGLAIPGSTGDGIEIQAGADGSRIEGLSITSFPDDGIVIAYSSFVRVDGCFVGVWRSSIVAGNGRLGIAVWGPDATIGFYSSSPSAVFEGRPNVVSGNVWSGIQVGGSRARIVGNRIGTNYTGTAVQPPFSAHHGNGWWGIQVSGSGVFGDDIEIGSLGLDGPGGSVEWRGNVIAGNQQGGIQLVRGERTRIHGNRIGSNEAGTFAFGNGSGPGVLVLEESQQAVIGAESPLVPGDSGGNTIVGHQSHGIHIVPLANVNRIERNAIGVGSDRETPLGNALDGIYCDSSAADTNIQHNVIGANGGAGIHVPILGGCPIGIFANSIGASPRGVDVGNSGPGVRVSGLAAGVEIGSSATAGLGNTIRFNDVGVQLGSGFDSHSIVANEISDNDSHGVYISGDDVTIGGDLGAAEDVANTIERNGGDGVRVSSTASEVRITRNRIGDNVGLGIDHEPRGTTGDWSCDPAQTNGCPTNPPLDPARAGWNAAQGTISLYIDPLMSSSPVSVDVYVADADDQEPLHYIGRTDFLTDPGGFVWRTITPVTNASVGPGTAIVAVKTPFLGSSSEASEHVVLPEPAAGTGLCLGMLYGSMLARSRRRRRRRVPRYEAILIADSVAR